MESSRAHNQLIPIPTLPTSPRPKNETFTEKTMAASSEKEGNPSSKLPVAPNMSQILNRISLGLARHERILKTLKRPAPTTSTSASSGAQSKSTASGFSSLATASYTNTSGSSTGGGVPISSTKEEEDRLFERDRALAPNAGIGFVEERKAGERGGKGVEDKMLRGRLLGRRGEKDKGGERKRYVDESEEEEGRSGLGKKKRRRKVIEDGDGAAERVDGGEGGADVAGVEDVEAGVLKAPTEMAVEVTTMEPAPQELDGAREERSGSPDGGAQGDGGVQDPAAPDAAELAREKKRKRKQAKRKRSKATKARGEETPTPGAASGASGSMVTDE